MSERRLLPPLRSSTSSSSSSSHTGNSVVTQPIVLPHTILLTFDSVLYRLKHSIPRWSVCGIPRVLHTFPEMMPSQRAEDSRGPLIVLLHPHRHFTVDWLASPVLAPPANLSSNPRWHSVIFSAKNVAQEASIGCVNYASDTYSTAQIYSFLSTSFETIIKLL